MRPSCLLAECVVLTASPVKREAIDAVGGYDENMPVQGDEDWDLWISLVERGFQAQSYLRFFFTTGKGTIL
jgi:hypothetical protein